MARRGRSDLNPNLLVEAVMTLGLELAFQEAEAALAKAQRSRAKNKADKLATAETRLAELEAMRGDLLGYWRAWDGFDDVGVDHGG